ncbi:MAG: outer membrane beta-barrel protein [Akkermansia sp.]|nr:outer membrane beta-barrel protein [Akkermansia sp.]
MKKTIILAAMLALPTFAGQKVIVNQAPVAPVAPAVASPWSIELATTYTWGVPDIYNGAWNNGHCKEIKSIGADITGVYAIDEHQAVTLRFGYTWGGEKWAADEEGSWNKTRIHTFSLMPGYRYTDAITDQLSWFVGANIGIANASYKDSTYYEKERLGSDHKAAWGFAYSAEVGLRYELTESLDVFCAYQYGGNTASPKIEGVRVFHRQHGHQARVGVGIKF